MTATLAMPLDVWASARTSAPDTSDFDQRHRRGLVRLPWDISDAVAGDLVDAWVCCDPACGGVELTALVLEINHGCCTPTRCCDEDAAGSVPARRHLVGYGQLHFTGTHHGPFTPFWEPSPAG